MYTLTDPRDGIIFYVGKGQRRRAWQHESDVRKGRVVGNYPKFCKIREILAAGLAVSVSIIARYKTSKEAFEHEERLIAEIGLLNLTNIQPGGGSDKMYIRDATAAFRRARGLAMTAIKKMGSFPSWLASCRSHYLFHDPLMTYCRFKDGMIEAATGVRGTEEVRLQEVDRQLASGNLLNSIFGKSKITEEDVLAAIRRLSPEARAELDRAYLIYAARG